MLQRVREVCLQAEWEGTVYQIVRLRNGEHAFTWRETAYQVGDSITPDEWNSPTVDHGAGITASYADAEHIYRECAEALACADPTAGRELLAILDETTH